MRVYLASWFNSIEEIRTRATELRASGVEVTSRWLEETVKADCQIKDVSEAYLRETARADVEDVLKANIVVLNTPSPEELKSTEMPTSSWARGGRHFEAGLHYATMMLFPYLPSWISNRGLRELVLVGHRENVFHHLDENLPNPHADNLTMPPIKLTRTWAEAKEYIVRKARCSVGSN